MCWKLCMGVMVEWVAGVWRRRDDRTANYDRHCGAHRFLL